MSDLPMFCKHRTVRRDTDGVYVGPGCARGHNVRSLVGGSDFGWGLRCPCILTERSKDVAHCPSADMESGEDHFAEPLALAELRAIWVDGPDSEAARATRAKQAPDPWWAILAYVRDRYTNDVVDASAEYMEGWRDACDGIEGRMLRLASQPTPDLAPAKPDCLHDPEPTQCESDTVGDGRCCCVAEFECLACGLRKCDGCMSGGMHGLCLECSERFSENGLTITYACAEPDPTHAPAVRRVVAWEAKGVLFAEVEEAYDYAGQSAVFHAQVKAGRSMIEVPQRVAQKVGRLLRHRDEKAGCR